MLERPITPSDIHRYLTIYAPKIRAVPIYERTEVEQVMHRDVCQALQLATSGKVGALAPMIKELEWTFTLEEGSDKIFSVLLALHRTTTRLFEDDHQ